MPSAGDMGNTSISIRKVSFRSLSHVVACGHCALGLKTFIVQWTLTITDKSWTFVGMIRSGTGRLSASSFLSLWGATRVFLPLAEFPCFLSGGF